MLLLLFGWFKFEALKHQTKITPNTDKKNVQNIICLPKDSQPVKTHTQAQIEKRKSSKKKKELYSQQWYVVTDKRLNFDVFSPSSFFVSLSHFEYESDANDRSQSKGVMNTSESLTLFT